MPSRAIACVSATATAGLVASAAFAAITFTATLSACRTTKPPGDVRDAQPDSTRPAAADAGPGCRTGDECLALGRAALQLAPPDPAKARYYLQSGCDLDYPLACAWLADRLVAGSEGMRRDERRALSLYEKACRLKDLEYCAVVASLLAGGSVTPGAFPKDPARAVELYESICRAGEADSCFWLSYIYETGRGVPRNRRRAREFARLAKKHGFVEGE